MSKVFVLDTHKTPLEPIHPGGARVLLRQGKAGISYRYCQPLHKNDGYTYQRGAPYEQGM